MKFADVCRTLPARPGGYRAAKILGESARVARKGDPLTGPGQTLGLLQSQPGLAAAGPAANLDPAQEGCGAEDDRLVVGELLDHLLALSGERDHVSLGQAASAEDLGEQIDIIFIKDAVAALLADGYGPQPAGEVGEVVTARHAPARAFRQREVGGDGGMRQHDGMRPAEPSAVTGLPPRIGLDITPQRVPGGARLVDRVDPGLPAAASLPPGLAVVPELATLDLDDHQPRPRQKDDQVGLVVLSVVGDSQVRVKDIL